LFSKAFDPGGMLKTGATLVRQWMCPHRYILYGSGEEGTKYEWPGRQLSVSDVMPKRINRHMVGFSFLFGMLQRVPC